MRTGPISFLRRQGCLRGREDELQYETRVSAFPFGQDVWVVRRDSGDTWVVWKTAQGFSKIRIWQSRTAKWTPKYVMGDFQAKRESGMIVISAEFSASGLVGSAEYCRQRKWAVNLTAGTVSRSWGPSYKASIPTTTTTLALRALMC